MIEQQERVLVHRPAQNLSIHFQSLVLFSAAYSPSMTRIQTHPPPRVPYSPLPVPERQPTQPSIRDDIRRTLHRHKFHPSPTHFTSIRSIYTLYLSDTQQIPTTAVENKFRSALGRVLSPPRRADAYAQSYAVPGLRRWNGYISIVAPGVECVDPRVENRNFKSELGRKLREVAKTSESVRELREERREKREREQGLPAREEPPQQVSFRYIDEFIALNSAEDLIQLKVSEYAHSARRKPLALLAMNDPMLTRLFCLFTDTCVVL